jgi:glutamate synthase (NADPH/NADH) small chain
LPWKRVALRLGAGISHIQGLRPMPVRKAEIQYAHEEGIILLLTNPIRFIDDGRKRSNVGKNGTGIRCFRRKPIPIAAVIQIEIDVANCNRNEIEPLLTKTIPNLVLNKRGYIVVDEETGMTSKQGVFAGGDIVTGSATVILAMGSGRNAAKAINEYLKWKYWDTSQFVAQ